MAKPLSPHLTVWFHDRQTQGPYGLWPLAMRTSIGAVHPGKLRVPVPSQDGGLSAASCSPEASSWGLSAQMAGPGLGPWRKPQQLPRFRGSCACLADSSSFVIFWKSHHLWELERSSRSVRGQAGSIGGFSRAVSHWMQVCESVPMDQVPRVSTTQYHRLGG